MNQNMLLDGVDIVQILLSYLWKRNTYDRYMDLYSIPCSSYSHHSIPKDYSLHAVPKYESIPHPKGTGSVHDDQGQR